MPAAHTLQDYGPFEEHGQAVSRGAAGDECGGENQWLEEACLDVGGRQGSRNS